LSANRLEEVNNYSGRMTSRKANMTIWGIAGFADRRIPLMRLGGGILQPPSIASLEISSSEIAGQSS